MIWSFSKSANFDLVSSSASTVSIEIIPSSVVSTSFSYSDEHDSISIRSETTVGVDPPGRVSDGRVSTETFSLIETLVDVEGDGDGIDEVDIDDVDCKLLVGMERGCV